MKVSVIIPVYNVEKYIERCARSLFEQTLEELEFVFVDDCSPDNSVEILESIIEDYPNRREQIKILRHETNKGNSVARNTGLSVVSGEYIAYCDSDDWVEPTMYEELYIKASTENADIVWSDFIMNFNYGERIIKMMPPDKNKKKTIEQYLVFGWNVLVNMLVKRLLYEKNNLTLYENYNFTEDYGLAIRLLYYATKVSYIEKAFYHYNRENQSSIVHQELRKDKREKMVNDEVGVCLLINDFFLQKGAYETFEKELSWRMLKAKRGWLYDRKHWNDYAEICPEVDKFYNTNPLVSKKDLLCHKLFQCSCTRPLILVVVFLEKLYNIIRIVK